ncbi:MAG TPA: restriction endonuclease subunit S [Anaerolineales bacterium]|nr:restriction endonuclease subunit S [Anaerolineales bacterium]
MIKLSDIFSVVYGHSLGLNKLELDNSGINFVSRSSANNGVAARVKLIPDLPPMPSGTITVALSGSVLESFVQPEPFYTSFHIYCLTPLEPMTFQEKIYYCMCIKANKYRYNYGRQANRTLRDILVPARNEIPKWVTSNDFKTLYKKEFLETIKEIV